MRADWDLETTVLLISLAIIPVLVAIILLCLKIKSKSNPDLFGVEGNIKKTKNDDAYTPATGSDTLNVSADDSNVRTPSYDRKLPDIPDDIYKNSSSKDDNSELYATVDEVPVAANGGSNITSRPDINTVSGTDNRNHQYAKVKKIRREEHPYAKVGECRDHEDNTDTEDYETTDKLSPRSRERLSGRSINGASSWGGRQDPDIPLNPSRQATPLPPEPPTFQDPHNQQHFSGDSQDSFSAKGYTSISVREPLAHIRDMRGLGGAGAGPGVQEGNYVTLSETSDEMYAAIEDTVYMNPGGVVSSSKEEQEEENDPSNMYSKVDKVKKRNNRQTKSYDPSNPYASVSKPSVNKEISQSSDNLGARPKQRSPRPPDTVDYSEYEVSHTDSRRSQPHLYNMTRSYHEDFSPRDPNYETLPYAESQLSERDPGYEIVERRDPDYETVSSDIKDKDPQYETVPQQRNRVNSIDPGYETVPNKEPGYESVKQPDPGYETVNHSRGQASRHRDPGYESVVPGRSTGQEPRYEDVYSVVNKKQRAAPAARLPGRKMSELSEEEGYETIPADKREREYDPGYETIVKSDRADVVSETASTDPDYARLKDADIEYIDESGDEVEDDISDLKTEEMRLEGGESNSLIHMSVVDTARGVRRSSVVVIEHVSEVPTHPEDDQEVHTHIFV